MLEGFLDKLISDGEVLLGDISCFPQSDIKTRIIFFDCVMQGHPYFRDWLVRDPDLVNIFLHLVRGISSKGRVLEAVVLVGHQLVLDEF